jgi:hypothetical protein
VIDLLVFPLLLTFFIPGFRAGMVREGLLVYEDAVQHDKTGIAHPDELLEQIISSEQTALSSTVARPRSSIWQIAEQIPRPGIPENRLLVLEWPGKIRMDDSESIILRLEMDATGIVTPTLEYIDRENRSGPVDSADVYDTHNVVAQARLDMPGVEHSPQGEISEPMRPGVPVQFIWKVRPLETGTQRGTIWLHLLFIPHDGSESSRQVLSVQKVEFEAVSLFGMGGPTARVIGTVGFFAGAFLGLDKFSSWLVERLMVSLRKTSPGNIPEDR